MPNPSITGNPPELHVKTFSHCKPNTAPCHAPAATLCIPPPCASQLTYVVVLHVIFPVVAGQRRGKVGIFILLPWVVIFIIVLGLCPPGVIHRCSRPLQGVPCDRHLAHSFGEIETLEAQGIGDVQRGELAGQRREGDVEVDAQQLAMQGAVHHQGGLGVNLEEGTELGGQQQRDAQRGGEGDGGASEGGFGEITASGGGATGLQIAVQEGHTGPPRRRQWEQGSTPGGIGVAAHLGIFL